MYASKVGIGKIAIMAAVASLVSSQSDADITDRISFHIEDVVIIWGGASDTESLLPVMPSRSSQANVDRSGLRTFVPRGAALIPASAASTRLQQVGYTGRSGYKFYVASNAAFVVDAEVNSRDVKSVGIDCDVSTGPQDPSFGQSAQLPHTSSRGGFNPDIESLGDLSRSGRLYTASRRTARTPGSIADQSVRFSCEYKRRAYIEDTWKTVQPQQPFDVTYTVAIP